MLNNKYYTENTRKIINTGMRFKHVMAITLDSNANYTTGFIRCIKSREGDITVKGYLDRSELYFVSGKSLFDFTIEEPLKIRNVDKILSPLISEGWDFIGFEDPDIFYDQEKKIYHLYFTIPIKPIDKSTGKKTKIHLGHAQGRDLHSLEMTEPVLIANEKYSAKEVSIAPVNKQGVRNNLIESRDRSEETSYSVIQLAESVELGCTWQYKNILFHPKEHNILWIKGHASPGPLFPNDFIDMGDGKLLGLINGREANQKIGDKVNYGMFSVGLFVYDYEIGKIDWVSPVPFIQDSEAIIITFASQFVPIDKDSGLIYAHVDDSFVRCYEITSKKLRNFMIDYNSL